LRSEEQRLLGKTASAEYSQGAADGSRPGVFYVPIPDIKNIICIRRRLVLHEAIPGHHFQTQENKSLPDFRKYNWFGAYGEGWALYTESLGKKIRPIHRSLSIFWHVRK
jgi:uncharacterized protein (DUF885 family)